MILELNLQFFAKDGPGGEKTEPATQKKLSDARKDGKVAKSKELGNGLGLVTFFVLLKIMAGSVGSDLLGSFTSTYAWIPQAVKYPAGDMSVMDMAGYIRETMVNMLFTLLPIFAVGVVISFIGDVAQVKWKPTSKPLQPKFSKINPLKGFKRIFSAQSLMELVKSVIKIVLIVYIAYSDLIERIDEFYLLYDLSIQQSILWIGDVAIGLGLKISIIYLILSFADFAYEKWKFKEDMKMTKQEVKEEYRNAEGDPQVKSKIKRKMLEVSQRRMMQDLPKADVVITNPTHLSVALQYDPEISDAPIVIAKGEDYLALKIREVAKEHNIMIVENKPVARMLYHNVDIGSAIPAELYQAVAEILAMVFHAEGRT